MCQLTYVWCLALSDNLPHLKSSEKWVSTEGLSNQTAICECLWRIVLIVSWQKPLWAAPLYGQEILGSRRERGLAQSQQAGSMVHFILSVLDCGCGVTGCLSSCLTSPWWWTVTWNYKGNIVFFSCNAFQSGYFITAKKWNQRLFQAVAVPVNTCVWTLFLKSEDNPTKEEHTALIPHSQLLMGMNSVFRSAERMA